MSTSPKTPGTTLAAQSAAEPSINVFQTMERMAATVAKSGLYGMKTPEQALTLMLLSRAEGIDPMAAVRDYHIISGRPALKADTMLARFQAAGGKVDWKEYTDAKVIGVFSHPQGGTVTVDWDIARATRAGLAARETWKSYPRPLMRARCISEGVRACYPGVAIGTYTVEEAQDMEVDITPTGGRVEAAIQNADHSLTEDERMEHFTAMDGAQTQTDLAAAFGAAWKHAGEAKDEPSRQAFKAVYDRRKAEIANVVPT